MSVVVKSRVKRSGNGFAQLAANLDARSGMIAYRAAIRIKALARGFSPVDTSQLKGSINAVKTGPAKWTVTVGAPYGIYVEYGTRYMAAQPYFKPAIKLAHRQLREELDSVFKSGNALNFSFEEN